MNVKIIGTDEAVEHARARLNEDWMVIVGDLNIIEHLENVVYTPGTNDNADFEVIGIMPIIFLGKKTKRLDDALQNQPVFDTTLALLVKPDEMLLMNYDKNEVSVEKAADDIVKLVRISFESGVLFPGLLFDE